MGVDCYGIFEKNKKAVVFEVPRDWCIDLHNDDLSNEYIEKGYEAVSKFFDLIVPEVNEAKGEEVAEFFTLGKFIEFYNLLDTLANAFVFLTNTSTGKRWLISIADRNSGTLVFVPEVEVEDYIVKKLSSGEYESVYILADSLDIDAENVVSF